MKKLLITLLLISFPAHAQRISTLPDTVVASPSAVLPMNEGSTTYKGKISDQVLHNIKAENGKTAAAFCDGTSHLASVSYATLAALQVDYPTAATLGQEMDGIVIEHYLENNTHVFLPNSTCLVNFEIQISNKDIYISQGLKGVLKATNFETGTAQAGSTTTITLKSTSVGVSDNIYNGMGVRIVAGTGSGQTREISGYVTATKVATVSVAFSTAPDATSQYELYPLRVITGTDLIFTGVNITTDGNNTAQNFLYLNGSTEETESYLTSFYGYGYGSDTWRSTNLVTPVWLNGRTSRNIWNGYKCTDIHSITNAQGGDNIGAARCFAVTPSASSAKISGIVYDYNFNMEGSDAEELDGYNLNVNAIFPSKWTMVNPEVVYTGKTRRLDKLHSGELVIINPNYKISSTFVTAPSALATTNIGEKNIQAIDYAGSGAGSISIFGGTVDLSGFQNGFTSTAACTDCFIKAYGTRFVGGDYDFNRFDPETEITGTATAGGADTITLDPEISNTTDNWYNGLTIDITAGTGSGQTKTVLDYTGATRVLQVSVAWTTVPDATSVYHVYETHSGSPVLFSTGTSDSGSGCQNCYFKEGVIGLQLRGYDGFSKDNYFYDTVKYPIYVNTSASRTGCVLEGNKVVTVTSGRMADASGIIPVQVCDKVNINNNELIQRGNTAHRAQFITLRTAAVTGVALNNKAPPTCDTCGTSPTDAVYKNSASLVRVHNDNGAGMSYEYRSTTSANNITTGEDTLHTYGLRPVAASETTSSVVLEGEGSWANNANTKTLKVHYGTTAIINKALTAAVAGVYTYKVEIFKTGTSTQRYVYELKYTGATTLLTEILAGNLTETETNTLTVKSTGEGVATSDIIENIFSVRLDN